METNIYFTCHGTFYNHFERSFFRSQTIQKQVPGWIWFRSYSVPTSHEPKADRWKKIPRFPRAHVKLALQSLPHPEPTANSRLCHHTIDESRVSRTLYLAMLPTLRNLVCFLISIFIFETRVSLLLTGLELIYMNSRVHRACLYLSSAGLLAQAKLPCFSLCILGTESRVFPCQAKCSTIKLYPWFTYILRLGLISCAGWSLACDPPASASWATRTIETLPGPLLIQLFLRQFFTKPGVH